MKTILFLIVFTMGCNQPSKPIAHRVDRDSIPDKVVTPKSETNIDSLTFNEFESLVKGEGIIPFEAFKKYVILNDSLFNNNTEFDAIGKGVSIEKEYKFIYIKAINGNDAKAVLVTYDKFNKQIDIKTFKIYCNICSNNELISKIIFSTTSKKIDFNVLFFKPPTSKEMPDEDKLDILLKETWFINSKGYFILRKREGNK